MKILVKRNKTRLIFPKNIEIEPIQIEKSSDKSTIKSEFLPNGLKFDEEKSYIYGAIHNDVKLGKSKISLREKNGENEYMYTLNIYIAYSNKKNNLILIKIGILSILFFLLLFYFPLKKEYPNLYNFISGIHAVVIYELAKNIVILACELCKEDREKSWYDILKMIMVTIVLFPLFIFSYVMVSSSNPSQRMIFNLLNQDLIFFCLGGLSIMIFLEILNYTPWLKYYDGHDMSKSKKR